MTRHRSAVHEDACLSVRELADLAGLSDRAVRKAIAGCADGRPWRGAMLQARSIDGRGGAAGTVHQVAIASLPPDLQQRARELLEAPASAPARTPAPVPRSLGELRLSAVLSVLAAGPKGSADRAARVAGLAATLRYPTGKRAGSPVGQGTIRAWVADYEREGLTAIKRKERSDRGASRVIAWAAWDAAMAEARVPADRQREIAAALDRSVRSFWASGAASASVIQFAMAPVCQELAEAHGVALDPAAMALLRRAPLHYIGARERRRARIAHIRKTDAGQWAARFVPRIRRHRDGLRPMDLVAADVRHSDILYCRPDGSLATAKMVAFLDLATNRLFARAFLLSAGEMIRREHVLASLRDMMADPAWGVPRCLYLDNGGEFRVGAAAEDLAHIADMVRRVGAIFEAREFEAAGEPGVMNSEAYNPQSKVIESVFSAFTRSIEPNWPGFVGGNRMAKKTENQGRAPRPMPGSEAAILSAYRDMIALWNAKVQQRGAIKGRSPDEAFAAAVTEGWRAVTLDAAEFDLAFGPDEWRTVQPGGELHIRNRIMRHDALVPMVGERVRVRVPILDDRRVVVLTDKGEPMCVAAEAERYGMRDLAGAGERKRRRRAATDAAAAAAAGTEAVDLQAALRRSVSARPKPQPLPPLATASVHPVLREAAAEPAPAPQRARRGNEKLLAAAREELAWLRRAG